MADTAALVVALSAQVSKFEKDMKDAVGVANKRTKEIETTFGKMNKEIESQFQNLAQIGLGHFGAVGSIFGKLGPLAITAAAGIGALTLGFNFLNNQVQEFIQQAGKLRDASDTTGLTIIQLKELGKIGLEVGVSAETVETSINRMTVAVDQLREGTGPLWEQLKKINPTLIGQVTNAKDSAEAIDILAKAFAELGSEFEKNAFLRAVFGRGGFSFGRVLQQIADAGGLKSLEQQAIKTGTAINDKLVKELDDMADNLEKIRKRTSDIWGTAFSRDILTAQTQVALLWERIAKAVADAYTNAQRGQPTNLLTWLLTAGGRTGIGGMGGARTSFDTRFSAVNERPLTQTTPMPPERPRSTAKTLEQEIQTMKEWIAAMGDAVNIEEKLWLQELELQKAVKDGTISREEATRASNVASLQQTAANAALQERLGIASEAIILEGKFAQIQLDVAKGTLTATDAIKAQTQARKEAKEAADALAVRTSNLPELTRFAQDAANGFKQFDQFATSAFSNFENSIADVATGAATLEEAFKKMADSIIRDLIRITIRMSVTGPLAKLLSGVFGGISLPGIGDTGNPFGRAVGGPVRAGSPYIVGEKGPELFVPTQAGTIVPNQLNSGRTASGTTVEINNYTSGETETRQTTRQDGPGAERIVIDIVKKAQARGDFDDVNRGRFTLRPAKVR